MRRPYRSRLAMCITAALLLASCALGAAPAAESPTPGAAGQPGPVTISFGAISFMRRTYEPLIDAFNREHPGIVVRFVSLDEAYQGGYDYDEQTRQIVSRADTAEAPADEQQFKLGLLRDLAPLIDADPTFDRADFYPGALADAT